MSYDRRPPPPLDSRYDRGAPGRALSPPGYRGRSPPPGYGSRRPPSPQHRGISPPSKRGRMDLPPPPSVRDVRDPRRSPPPLRGPEPARPLPLRRSRSPPPRFDPRLEPVGARSPPRYDRGPGYNGYERAGQPFASSRDSARPGFPDRSYNGGADRGGPGFIASLKSGYPSSSSRPYEPGYSDRNGPGYNDRPSYGNDRPAYGNDRDAGYGSSRARSGYGGAGERGGPAYSADRNGPAYGNNREASGAPWPSSRIAPGAPSSYDDARGRGGYAADDRRDGYDRRDADWQRQDRGGASGPSSSLPPGRGGQAEPAPPPPLPARCNEDEKTWYYIDPQNQTQGPCSINQFKTWIKQLKSDRKYDREYEQFVKVDVWQDGMPNRIPLLTLVGDAR